MAASHDWRTRRAPLAAGEDLDPEARAVYEETTLATRIAESVYERRRQLGWSQKDLAERAGMHRSDIARLESSLTLPTTRTLNRIALPLDARLVVGFDDLDRAA